MLSNTTNNFEITIRFDSGDIIQASHTLPFDDMETSEARHQAAKELRVLADQLDHMALKSELSDDSEDNNEEEEEVDADGEDEKEDDEEEDDSSTDISMILNLPAITALYMTSFECYSAVRTNVDKFKLDSGVICGPFRGRRREGRNATPMYQLHIPDSLDYINDTLFATLKNHWTEMEVNELRQHYQSALEQLEYGKTRLPVLKEAVLWALVHDINPQVHKELEHDGKGGIIEDNTARTPGFPERIDRPRPYLEAITTVTGVYAHLHPDLQPKAPSAIEENHRSNGARNLGAENHRRKSFSHIELQIPVRALLSKLVYPVRTMIGDVQGMPETEVFRKASLVEQGEAIELSEAPWI